MTQETDSQSYRGLPVKHSGAALGDAIVYLKKRMSGAEKSLDTGFSKLNKALTAGLDWNKIFTIAGMSGGGKSITLELIKENIIHLNSEVDFDVLSFDLEMPAQDQALRLLSNKLSLSREELLSLEEPLKLDKLMDIEASASELKDRPVYVVETPGTSSEIYSTIMDFIVTRKLAERQRGLIVTIDHILLTKGGTGEGEKEIIDNLCKMFVQLKKECINMKVKIIIMMLSQLNRDIESKERVLNPKIHYPNKNDLFAASSIYYSSDYVLVTHKPSLISGIDHFYGPPRGTKWPKGLPV